MMETNREIQFPCTVYICSAMAVGISITIDQLIVCHVSFSSCPRPPFALLYWWGYKVPNLSWFARQTSDLFSDLFSDLCSSSLIVFILSWDMTAWKRGG